VRRALEVERRAVRHACAHEPLSRRAPPRIGPVLDSGPRRAGLWWKRYSRGSPRLQRDSPTPASHNPSMQPKQPSERRDPGDDTGPRTFYVVVAALASVIFTAISLAPSEGGVAKYRWSFVFLVPIVWIFFALRRRMALRPVLFGLFALALVLHDLGAFGWYQRKFVGVQYDWYVHTFFGFVGGLIVARILEVRIGLRGRVLAPLAVLVVTGFGGLHEIMEAASNVGARYRLRDAGHRGGQSLRHAGGPPVQCRRVQRRSRAASFCKRIGLKSAGRGIRPVCRPRESSAQIRVAPRGKDLASSFDLGITAAPGPSRISRRRARFPPPLRRARATRRRSRWHAAPSRRRRPVRDPRRRGPLHCATSRAGSRPRRRASHAN